MRWFVEWEMLNGKTYRVDKPFSSKDTAELFMIVNFNNPFIMVKNYRVVPELEVITK